MLTVVVLANLGERSGVAASVAYTMFVASAALLALGSGVSAFAGQASLRGEIGLALQTAAPLVGCLALLPQVRRAVAGPLSQFRPESPVHAVALGYYLLLLLLQAGNQVAADQVKAVAQGDSPSLLFIISSNQLPMFLVSIAGVGLWVRRTPSQALARLGLWWPGWRWIAGALVVSCFLLLAGFVFDYAMFKLTPEQNSEIQKVTEQLFKNADNVLGIVAIGLAAGIGEEIFFRGAIQPRFGIIPASILFAALHNQYGVTIATAEILFIGIVLGMLRNRAGTLTAIVAHAGYDIIVGALPMLPH